MNISGRIVDYARNNTGIPDTEIGIADANIQIANASGVPLSSTVWQTDNDGYFAIDAPVSLQPYLLISRAAYESLLVSPDDYYNGIYIAMQRTGELQEVTVTAKKKSNWFGWAVVAAVAGKVFYDYRK